MADQEAKPSFTCFPKLPVEIRHLIWEAVLPGPRIVEIRQRPKDTTIGIWERRRGLQWPPPLSGEGDDEREIRCQLARASIIRDVDGDEYDEDVYRQARLLEIWSYAPRPYITYVCREAEEVVLRFYTRCFGTAYSIPRAYFNLWAGHALSPL
ncbi:hypothetical protein DL98DRAFT_73150 [Cadophora sp. DSE1049]|nr:hypothetical protein DL98DRAFT_73150 [Cadophora sp. DSE1049]